MVSHIADSGNATVGVNQGCSADWWYSRCAATISLFFLFLLVQSISYLIAPFQSPDEFNHLKRAYLLSKGEVFLSSKNNHTGGNIDTGLLDYMGCFDSIPFNYDKQITNTDVAKFKEISWSGQRQFSELPNTAFYFPLPYVPQALALGVGEKVGLSVSNTYYLARLFSLTATLGLLWTALQLYPVPLVVLALFATPMTLFQLGSASLDSISFALSALAAALFMRGANKKYSFTVVMHISLFICLFSLATSRFNLIALTPLPAVLYTIRGSRSYLVSFGTLTLGSLAWILFALKTVQGMPPRQLSTIDTISYYLGDIGAFVHVLFATITNGAIINNYWNMFIGVLGWADTPLGTSVYAAFGVLFATLAFVSLQRQKAYLLTTGSVALVCGAAMSLFLLFVVLLVAWSPHPARAIEGMQGRYFTPILILLGFSIFGRRLSVPELRMGLAVIFGMVALSIVSMEPRLLSRYWISGDVEGDLDYESKYGWYTLQPSEVLNESSTIKIMMTTGHKSRQVSLKRIGVMFVRNAAPYSGIVELHLVRPDASAFVQRFSMESLRGDKYLYFNLDLSRYIAGEIVSVTATGISAWESRDKNGSLYTCLEYEYVDGERRFTPGCPLF